MNFTFRTSLEHTALVKIAAELWKEHDRSIMQRSRLDAFLSMRHEWPKVEEEVAKKVLKLPLPESLRKKLLCFVSGAGRSLYVWECKHNDIVSEDYVRNNADKFCWTPQGTVDSKKTTEVFVQDENICVRKRYELACLCCLEDYIYHLWEMLDDSDKKELLRNDSELVSHWSDIMAGQNKTLGSSFDVSPSASAFLESAQYANDVATAYFFQKLTPEEKEKILLKTTIYLAEGGKHFSEYYTDVLCFLLSNMNKQQQEKVLRSCPTAILRSFLNWPLQDLFMDIAERVLPFLSEADYLCILELIVQKVEGGYADCDYQKLFRIFWQRMPIIRKTFVLNASVNNVISCETYTYFHKHFLDILLFKLLLIGNTENFKLVLKDASILQKESLLCPSTAHNCEDLIYHFNLDALKVLFQTCVASKRRMIHFMKMYKERSQCVLKKDVLTATQLTREEQEIKWKNFFQLINDLIEEHEKKRGTRDL